MADQVVKLRDGQIQKLYRNETKICRAGSGMVGEYSEESTE